MTLKKSAIEELIGIEHMDLDRNTTIHNAEDDEDDEENDGENDEREETEEDDTDDNEEGDSDEDVEEKNEVIAKMLIHRNDDDIKFFGFVKQGDNFLLPQNLHTLYTTLLGDKFSKINELISSKSIGGIKVFTIEKKNTKSVINLMRAIADSILHIIIKIIKSRKLVIEDKSIYLERMPVIESKEDLMTINRFFKTIGKTQKGGIAKGRVTYEWIFPKSFAVILALRTGTDTPVFKNAENEKSLEIYKITPILIQNIMKALRKSDLRKKFDLLTVLEKAKLRTFIIKTKARDLKKMLTDIKNNSDKDEQVKILEDFVEKNETSIRDKMKELIGLRKATELLKDISLGERKVDRKEYLEELKTDETREKKIGKTIKIPKFEDVSEDDIKILKELKKMREIRDASIEEKMKIAIDKLEKKRLELKSDSKRSEKNYYADLSQKQRTKPKKSLFEPPISNRRGKRRFITTNMEFRENKIFSKSIVQKSKTTKLDYTPLYKRVTDTMDIGGEFEKMETLSIHSVHEDIEKIDKVIFEKISTVEERKHLEEMEKQSNILKNNIKSIEKDGEKELKSVLDKLQKGFEDLAAKTSLDAEEFGVMLVESAKKQSELKEKPSEEKKREFDRFYKAMETKYKELRGIKPKMTMDAEEKKELEILTKRVIDLMDDVKSSKYNTETKKRSHAIRLVDLTVAINKLKSQIRQRLDAAISDEKRDALSINITELAHQRKISADYKETKELKEQIRNVLIYQTVQFISSNTQSSRYKIEKLATKLVDIVWEHEIKDSIMLKDFYVKVMQKLVPLYNFGGTIEDIKENRVIPGFIFREKFFKGLYNLDSYATLKQTDFYPEMYVNREAPIIAYEFGKFRDSFVYDNYILFKNRLIISLGDPTAKKIYPHTENVYDEYVTIDPLVCTGVSSITSAYWNKKDDRYTCADVERVLAGQIADISSDIVNEIKEKFRLNSLDSLIELEEKAEEKKYREDEKKHEDLYHLEKVLRRILAVEIAAGIGDHIDEDIVYDNDDKKVEYMDFNLKYALDKFALELKQLFPYSQENSLGFWDTLVWKYGVDEASNIRPSLFLEPKRFLDLVENKEFENMKCIHCREFISENLAKLKDGLDVENRSMYLHLSSICDEHCLKNNASILDGYRKTKEERERKDVANRLKVLEKEAKEDKERKEKKEKDDTDEEKQKRFIAYANKYEARQLEIKKAAEMRAIRQEIQKKLLSKDTSAEEKANILEQQKLLLDVETKIATEKRIEGLLKTSTLEEKTAREKYTKDLLKPFKDSSVEKEDLLSALNADGDVTKVEEKKGKSARKSIFASKGRKLPPPKAKEYKEAKGAKKETEHETGDASVMCEYCNEEIDEDSPKMIGTLYGDKLVRFCDLQCYSKYKPKKLKTPKK